MSKLKVIPEKSLTNNSRIVGLLAQLEKIGSESADQILPDMSRQKFFIWLKVKGSAHISGPLRPLPVAVAARQHLIQSGQSGHRARLHGLRR
ncbi:uncharacterized protein LOC143677393 isoform X2 [Tamandua tetradactyla]|uniref:uncharacterized protein LOC143677393 isoform X2 n=1 Tax=Tamandua tetradactyla TaxID=48850 RepID=UPI004053C0D2